MKRITIILFLLILSINANADTIIFKNGKQIKAKTVWEEGDFIKCEKFGSIVSYPKSKVERIESKVSVQLTTPNPYNIPRKDIFYDDLLKSVKGISLEKQNEVIKESMLYYDKIRSLPSDISGLYELGFECSPGRIKQL